MRWFLTMTTFWTSSLPLCRCLSRPWQRPTTHTTKSICPRTRRPSWRKSFPTPCASPSPPSTSAATSSKTSLRPTLSTRSFKMPPKHPLSPKLHHLCLAWIATSWNQTFSSKCWRLQSFNKTLIFSSGTWCERSGRGYSHGSRGSRRARLFNRVRWGVMWFSGRS